MTLPAQLSRAQEHDLEGVGESGVPMRMSASGKTTTVEYTRPWGHRGLAAGHYETSPRAGAGAMGEFGRRPRPGRDVAAKVLSPVFAADPDRLRRFEQEARAIATLNHPNIVGIYDGPADGRPFRHGKLRRRPRASPSPPLSPRRAEMGIRDRRRPARRTISERPSRFEAGQSLRHPGSKDQDRFDSRSRPRPARWAPTRRRGPD
jgi:hypothetical protein